MPLSHLNTNQKNHGKRTKKLMEESLMDLSLKVIKSFCCFEKIEKNKRPHIVS
jgi:hypothetical protein